MLRLADNHTNIWLELRPKDKMDGEITKHWSTNKLGWQFTNSYIIPKCGGLQGIDRAVTTCRLPTLSWSTVIFIGSLYTRAPCPCIWKLPLSPQDSDPMDQRARTRANLNVQQTVTST
jgi:hypothetical protein